MGALLDPLRCDAWRSMLIGCFRPEAVIRHVSEKNRFWVLCPEINSSEDKGNPKLDWWLNITNNFYALQPYEGAGVDFTEENIAAGRLSLLIKPDDIANLADAKRAVIDDFLRNCKIFVYLDDFDRGWQGDPHNIRKLSALLNAVRDLASECKGVCFRISLRSDVYFLVRTSDESID